jgi:hypothetical protein
MKDIVAVATINLVCPGAPEERWFGLFEQVSGVL